MSRTSLRATRALALCVLMSACARGGDPADAMRRGDALFDQKRYRLAVQAYREVVQAQPSNQDARTKLGRALAAAGDPVRAADLLPDDEQVLLEAAASRQDKSRFQDAIGLANRMLARNPANARALVVLAGSAALLPNSGWPISELAQRIGDATRFENFRKDARPTVPRVDEERAERLFKQALALSPELFEARLGYSNFLWATGRQLESEPWLRAAAQQAPDNAIPSFALGALYVSQGRADEALPFLEQARQGKGPASRSATFIVADHYLSTNRPEDARGVLEPLLEADDDGDVSLRMAIVEERTGHTADAVRRLNRLVARKPAHAAGHLTRARLLYALGNPDERFARQAATVDDGSPEAHMLLGRVLAERGQVDAALDEYRQAAYRAPLDARPLLAMSRTLLDIGSTPRALSYARDATRLAPGDKDAMLALVTALIAQQKLNDASSALAPVAARLPKDPQVALIEGRLSLARGDAASARASYTRALASGADTREALQGLIQAEGAQPSVSTRQRVEAAIEATPSDPELRLLAGQVYRAMNDLPRAEAALQQAQRLSPTHVPIALELAGVLMAAHRPAEASAALERVVPARPARLSEVRVALAAAYQAQGKRADAQRQYEQLVVEMPGAVEPAVVLATMYLEQKDKLTQALELALSAKRGRPLDPDIDMLLGRIYSEKGMGSLAVPVLEHAVEARPGSAPYHFHLGAAYELAGNMSKARAEYAQALQLDPNLPNADRARQMAASRR